MNARPADRLAIALAQLNPTVGDVAGNAEKVRRARATAAGAGRRPRHFSRAVHRRLSARGPRAQAGVPGGLPRGGRGAGARDRRRRPGGAGRRALGRGRQALQRLPAARGRQDRGRALQGRPAELRRVRREARVRARPDAGADRAARRAHRHSGVRGHLAAGRGRVHRRDRRRNPAGAERLALLARQDAGAAQHRGRARGRERPAAGLSQHGRRAGRTGVRRRLVRPAMPTARSRSSFRRSARRSSPRNGCARTATWRCLPARERPDRGGRRGRLCGLRARPARLCRQERLQGRGVRPLRRHRLARSAPRWRSMRSGRAACAP